MKNKVYKEFKIRNVQDYKYNKHNKKHYNQYSNKTRNLKKKRFSIDKALADKLDREFKDYCQNLLKKDKQIILNSAYEITVKEEIKDAIKHMNLYDQEKEMMLLQDNVLNEFYHDWLDCDTPLSEVLEDCLSESVATLTKYIGVRKELALYKEKIDNKEIKER